MGNQVMGTWDPSAPAVCASGAHGWGDRHGVAGAPHRTQGKGEEPHPKTSRHLEDVG